MKNNLPVTGKGRNVKKPITIQCAVQLKCLFYISKKKLQQSAVAGVRTSREELSILNAYLLPNNYHFNSNILPFTLFIKILYITIEKASIDFVVSKPWNTLLDNFAFIVSTRELLTKVCVPPGYHSIIIQLVVSVVSEIQYFDSSCPIIRSWCPHDNQFLQQEKQEHVGKRVGDKNNNQNFTHEWRRDRIFI